MREIYLDHNATTPVAPEVCEAMLPFLGGSFGNPSSMHRHGRAARRAVDTARAQVARLLNASPAEIVFTSGGTEGNNLALRAVLARGVDYAFLLNPDATFEPAALRRCSRRCSSSENSVR